MSLMVGPRHAALLSAGSPIQALQSRIDRSRCALERACHFWGGHFTVRHLYQLLFFLLCPTRRRTSWSGHFETLDRRGLRAAFFARIGVQAE